MKARFALGLLLPAAALHAGPVETNFASLDAHWFYAATPPGQTALMVYVDLTRTNGARLVFPCTEPGVTNRLTLPQGEYTLSFGSHFLGEKIVLDEPVLTLPDPPPLTLVIESSDDLSTWSEVERRVQPAGGARRFYRLRPEPPHE